MGHGKTIISEKATDLKRFEHCILMPRAIFVAMNHFNILREYIYKQEVHKSIAGPFFLENCLKSKLRLCYDSQF